MVKHNQDGAASSLTISLVLCVCLLIAAISFGVWAYLGRQDYKNNTDSKIQTAVQAAVKKEDQVKDNYYAEQAKFPLTSYAGPAEFGSIVVYYPKTWSAYINDNGVGDTPIDGYFNPGHVPAVGAPNSAFALKVKVINQNYNDVVQQFSSQVRGGGATSSAYALPKLPNVVGVKLSGNLVSGSRVVSTMVILPIRSNTLEISTDGTAYLGDFNQNVLPNFSFSP